MNQAPPVLASSSSAAAVRNTPRPPREDLRDDEDDFRFRRSRRFSGSSRLALMADEGMAQDRVAVSEGWGQHPVPSRRLPGLCGSYPVPRKSAWPL